jgi:hypothetical protein
LNSSEEAFLLPDGFLTELDPQIRLLTLPNFGVNTSYHPQTDGQTERINQILEDMLRASILQFDKSWDKYLSVAEFSYNNSYQACLKMAPFDAPYGRRCRTPLNWSETGEMTLFGPDLVKDAEAKVQVIRENLKMAQMRQKSYHDKGMIPQHFEVGDYVYLKVSL